MIINEVTRLGEWNNVIFSLRRINMEWCIKYIGALSSTIGLIFDVIGAWLVAYEVVNQYRGERFISPNKSMAMMTDTSSLPPAAAHPQYRNYETVKYRKMKWGLAFLTIGFILQIVPNAMQLFCK